MPISPQPPAKSLVDVWTELGEEGVSPVGFADAMARTAVAAVRGALCGGGELLDFAARKGVGPRGARKNAQALAGLLKLACPNVPPGASPPSGLTPIYDKGQCAGVQYIVTTRTKSFRTAPQCFDQNDSITSRSYIGPIRSIFKALEQPSGCGNQPSEAFKEIRIVTGTPPIEGSHALESGNSLFKGDIEITITRNDGLPDECGEPRLPPVPPA